MFTTTIQSLATNEGEPVVNKTVYFFKGVIYGVRDMGNQYRLPGEGYTYVNVTGKKAPISTVTFEDLYETHAAAASAISEWDSLYLNYISLSNDGFNITNALCHNVSCAIRSGILTLTEDEETTTYYYSLDISMSLEVQEEYSD